MGVIPAQGLPSPVSKSTILSTLASKSSFPSSGFFGVEMKICTLELALKIPLPSASEKAPGILARSSGSPSSIVLRTSRSNLLSSPKNDGDSQ